MEHCGCDTSCYNCLRSYSNQRRHQDLDRHLAQEFLSAFLGEATELKLQETQEAKELKLLADGLNVKTEDYDYIFSLLDDASNVAQELLDKFIEKSLLKPDLNDIGFKIDGETGYANLLWKDKKVMLFTKDNENSYVLATKSNYRCFILDETFNLTLFLKALD